MLIEFISDLHGYQPELKGGDLLIIAGDLTARDKKEEYEKFLFWLSNLPHRYKIVIAGNHDGLIEKGKVTIGAENIYYLCDSGVELEGLKIWGSPYTPTFESWHFMRDRGQDIKKHWDRIPADIDILVTHGPPYGIFDDITEKLHVGCEDLRAAVQERIKPRIHCFGHIHECGNNIKKIDSTTYVNCSYVDEEYRPVNTSVQITLVSESPLRKP
jgi:Icc-related predicted phosphoesterase